MTRHKNRLIANTIIFVLTITCFCSANAQLSLEDSLLYKETVDNIFALHKNKIGEKLHLYNGSEYLFSGHNVKGFPYFKSPDVLPGSIYYDGNLYRNVSMYYDLTTDEVVIMDYTNNYPIKLITDKIDYFLVDSALFVNSEMRKEFAFTTAGFYEELYRGRTIIFAKRKKIFITKKTLDEYADVYESHNNYFIYSNEKMYKVSGEKSILKAFGRSSLVKKFINNNRQAFKTNFEEALIRTAQYFDQTKN